MTGMEDVLAAHWPVYRWSPIYEANVWACSTGLCDVLGDFEKVIKHQAAELAAAGFGNLHDAWAEGWGHYRQHFGILDPEFANNPYPEVSET